MKSKWQKGNVEELIRKKKKSREWLRNPLSFSKGCSTNPRVSALRTRENQCSEGKVVRHEEKRKRAIGRTLRSRIISSESRGPPIAEMPAQVAGMNEGRTLPN